MLLLVPGLLFSQVRIKGPDCVKAGTVYQYGIEGSWDSASTMQLCVTGGALADSGANCTTGGTLRATVMISWDSAASSGSLSLSSSKGNATLQVSITRALRPGEMDSTNLFQLIDSGAVPHDIVCPAATGGSCSPLYSYQWQRSPDAIEWTDVPGAGGESLSFQGPPEQTAFYRRKVKETGSGAIGYTEPATIVIMAVRH
jgi:hypothetical protein